MSTTRTTFFTMIYKGLLSGLGFVSSAALAWALSKPDRVEFQFAGTIAQTGMTFVGGFTNYYAYALPKYPEDERGVVQTGNVFVGLVSLLVLAAALTAFFTGAGKAADRPWRWALLCMPLTFIFGYGSRLLQASDEIAWLNRVNTLQPLVFLLFVGGLFALPYAARDSARLTGAYAAWVGSFALAAVLTMIIAYRRLRCARTWVWRIHPRHWRETWRYGGWSSISQVVNILNYRMDFWLVYRYLPAAEASVYGIAVVASEVLLNISGSIQSVVFRRMTGPDRRDAIAITELSCRQTLLSSALVALAMCVTFPWLILFAYPGYGAAIVPFFILLPGLVVKAASNIVIQYATNALGQPRTSIWMNGVSALVNAAACVMFLPTLGMVGGAIASTLSYVVSFIIYIVWFSRVSGRSGASLYRIRREDLAPYRRMWDALRRRVGRR
ncbi:polysaccharide biosynthesis C-terminal domain-containing protein [Alicyclobacillus sp.]|uniref:lipopolysaccharide biosynthesis protein n=1 Tax=Alicyclobacillus sp. TaxID=61169 RepID=UPI0025C14C56|nr:polysaccharide biosynthesis C-terminal domain-containing protein [Alicyclobacillus sp.]MCL6516725.1 polysaccharide biosynthesis C-terminal domain-containing protein [Alicyclobacillus sp.]